MSKRRRFFVTYIATALVSFTVVFFGAPLVRGSIPPERLDRMVKACRSDAPLSGVMAAMIGSKPTPPPEYIPDRPRGPQPTIPRSNRPHETHPSRPDISPVQSKPLPDQTSVAKSANPPTTEDNYNSMWAIVTNDNAAVYDENGDLAQELGPGTLLEVAAVRANSSAEQLAICRYDTKPASMKIAFVRARDLLVRKGSLDSASADLITLLTRQAQLEAELRALQNSIARDLASQNPHTEAYNSARSKILAFNEKARSLNARKDNLQGSARMELMDKLRSMKEEQVQLTKTYDAAKRAFEAWNQSHPSGLKESEPVKALQKELADIRKQVQRTDSN